MLKIPSSPICRTHENAYTFINLEKRNFTKTKLQKFESQNPKSNYEHYHTPINPSFIYITICARSRIFLKLGSLSQNLICTSQETACHLLALFCTRERLKLSCILNGGFRCSVDTSHTHPYEVMCLTIAVFLAVAIVFERTLHVFVVVGSAVIAPQHRVHTLCFCSAPISTNGSVME